MESSPSSISASSSVPLFSSSFTPPPSHLQLLNIFLSLCHSSSFPFLDHLFLPPFLQISAPPLHARHVSFLRLLHPLLPPHSYPFHVLLLLSFSTVLLLPCCKKKKGKSRVHSRGSGQPGARLPAEWRPGPRGSQTKQRAEVPDAVRAEHHDDPGTDLPPVDHHVSVVS